MSVHIEIKMEHGTGAFRRKLEIHRADPVVGAGERDPFGVELYVVNATGGNQRFDQRETFAHRYGDDLYTLLVEAIDALGGRGGHFTTGVTR